MELSPPPDPAPLVSKQRSYAKRISIHERDAKIQQGQMWCPRCRVFKSFSEFNKDKHKPHGIATTCSDCFNKRRAETRSREQERQYTDRLKLTEKQTPPKKLCPKCNQVKPSFEFAKASGRKTGLRPYCKACNNAAKRKYVEENTEKVHEYNKQYDKAHPERGIAKQRRRRAKVSKAGGTYSAKQAEQLKKFYCPGGLCLKCGQPRKLILDHVTPVDLGGSSFIYNLQPLCQPCNAKKYTKVQDYRPDGGAYAADLYRESLCQNSLALL